MKRTGVVGAASPEACLTAAIPAYSGIRHGVKGGKVAPLACGAQMRPQKRGARRAVSVNMRDTINQRRFIVYCICGAVLAE